MGYIHIVFWLLGHSSAFAWDDFGHRVSASVAAQNLCPKAAAEVAYLLGKQTLEDVSTWADHLRYDPDMPDMSTWHYVNMPFGTKYADSWKDPDGDVVVAVEATYKELSSRDPGRRSLGLRLLVHFVADAHQPFHAGSARDRGGNLAYVDWGRYKTNLHRVWDKDLPEAYGESRSEFIRSSAIAPVPGDTLNPEDWADESSAIAARAYPADGYVGRAYIRQFAPLAKRRLIQSGYRLAALINQAFGCSGATPTAPAAKMALEAPPPAQSWWSEFFSWLLNY